MKCGRAPVRTGRLEEGDPLLPPIGGLEHMGERVGRPAVGRIARQRLAAHLLGVAEFARFLEAEGIGAEDEAVSGLSRSHAGRTRATELRIASEWP